MRIVNPSDLDKTQSLQIGKQGENMATAIDFSDFLAACRADYGTGTLSLSHQRAEDSAPYAVSLDGALWKITSSDLQYPGTGLCELTYTVGTTIKKSRHWKTNVLSALGATVTPPAAWQSYIDSVMAAVASIEDMTVSATTLSAGSSATVTKSTANGVTHLTFGLPRGQNGKDGKDGKDAEITHNNIVSALGYTPANATALTGKQDVIDDLDTIRSKANSALQSETDPTVPSWAKQQSKPTYQANEIVMGDSTVGAEISELSEDIVGKLSEPSSGLAVGKYFRIASIDASGHAVLEACDAPATDVQINGTSITQDGVADIPPAALNNYGVVRFGSSDYGLVSKEIRGQYYIVTAPAGQTHIDNRLNTAWTSVSYKPIVPNNLDYAVKAAMCDGVGVAWSATEQAAARSRMGLDKEWVLKGTMTTTDPCTVDLSGCTEMTIIGNVTATANVNLSSSIGLLVYLFGYNGTRTTYGHWVDSFLGIECASCRYGTGVTTQTAAAGQGYSYSNGKNVSRITTISFSNASVVTTCDIKIYAR